MKNNISNKDDASEKIKEDIKALKKDMENLAQRISNIKDDSKVLMFEQLDDLFSTLASMKDKTVGVGRDCTADLYSSTRKHPIRNLAYAFGIGFILAYIIGR